MKRSRLLMFYVGMMLVGVLAVACASGEVASGESATATPTPVAPDPTSPAPTSVPPTLVNEQVREIPPLLLADPLPNPAVQITLWNEYFLEGTLRSLDGLHSLNICARSDGDLKGTATGLLASGEEWSGSVQLENPDAGWESTGLVIGSDRNGQSYLLKIVNGTPTLVPNTQPSAEAIVRGIEIENPDFDSLPFEVIEGADCL